jgi:hypothetical protein
MASWCATSKIEAAGGDGFGSVDMSLSIDRLDSGSGKPNQQQTCGGQPLN